MNMDEDKIKNELLGHIDEKNYPLKPDKESLETEFITEGAVIMTFCSRCGRYYDTTLEGLQGFLNQTNIDVEKLKGKYNEVNCCEHCCDHDDQFFSELKDISKI